MTHALYSKSSEVVQEFSGKNRLKYKALFNSFSSIALKSHLCILNMHTFKFDTVWFVFDVGITDTEGYVMAKACWESAHIVMVNEAIVFLISIQYRMCLCVCNCVCVSESGGVQPSLKISRTSALFPRSHPSLSLSVCASRTVSLVSSQE